MKRYDRSFYQDMHSNSLHAAETVLSIVLEAVPGINSAVDIGCGVGSWLSVLKEKGIDDILGIDGKWVNKEQLQIHPDFFLEYDLNRAIELPKKFDLAISLEVAEHLSPDRAEMFVRSLTNLADIVLFSAAVPGQGGTKHVNEQWQDYWVEIFRKQGYTCFDFIRKKIWNDQSIPFWYKQNILLFVSDGKEVGYSMLEKGEQIPFCVVHPDLYIKRVVRPSFVQPFKTLFKWLKNSVGNTLS
jgi:hypothetical protein